MKSIYAIVVIFLATFSYSDNLEISADKFTAKDSDKKIRFLGNVNMAQGATSVKASNITIYFNDDNSTKKYRAFKKVKFVIKKNKANYKGTCDLMEYFPEKQQYVLSGNVKVKDNGNKRSIMASKITIDSKTGAFSIEGNKKKAAKLTFEIK